mmetsp:Transcript_24016/g.31160  ORF Transcript_24016/g.31160 Transcript_24016/m.31160 type:complete len:296 (-) Transcript_24016:243-1130(-)
MKFVFFGLLCQAAVSLALLSSNSFLSSRPVSQCGLSSRVSFPKPLLAEAAPDGEIQKTRGNFQEISFKAMLAAEAKQKGEQGFLDNFTDFTVGTLKGGINLLYGDRHFARFYALETIARVPYFSYLSVLHLYETLGRWRNQEILKLHFAESWNELHHLLIMEELGGDDQIFDRLFAVHAAFFYYFIVVGAYMLNPEFAYNLNKKVEQHAWRTYADFVEQNGEMLKEMPVPDVARKYYQEDEIFLEEVTDIRKPIKLETLYDVFVQIRDDEAEHALSMGDCEKQSAEDFQALGGMA